MKKWDALSADEKKMFIRQADVYAAYLAYADHEIGRVIQAVEDNSAPRDFEYLPRKFQIAPGIVLPIGGYDYDTVRMTYELGQQRRASGRLSVASGTFYDGHKQEANFTSGRVALSARVSIEPGLTMNWVTLPSGSFTNRLLTARGVFTPTPRTLVSSLMQYNASDRTMSSSVRLRWEYVPGSELFVVYSDGRNTSEAPLPGLVNRSVAIKLTRLLRF